MLPTTDAAETAAEDVTQGDNASVPSTGDAEETPDLNPVSGGEETGSLTTGAEDTTQNETTDDTSAPAGVDGGDAASTEGDAGWSRTQYAEEIQRLKRRQGGAESAYRRASDLARQRQEENDRLQRQLMEAQGRQNLPVWHHAHPGHADFRSKRRLFEVMERQGATLDRANPEHVAFFESQWQGTFTDEELDAISQQRKQGQQLLESLAGGDLSGLDDYIHDRFQQLDQKRSAERDLKNELGRLLDENTELWKDDPSELQEWLQQGKTLDRFVAMKNEEKARTAHADEIAKLQKEIADLKARQDLSGATVESPERDAKRARGRVANVDEIDRAVRERIKSEGVASGDWARQAQILREEEAKFVD